MDVRLKVLGGPHHGEEIAILADVFLIGRGEECHLRPQSDLISRRHCAVEVGDKSVLLREFGSKNGTFVNDERVNGQRELASGDRLRVGQLQFEVLIAPSADDELPKAATAHVAGAAMGIVETARPPAADTMQIAPPTIVSDRSEDENPSGFPPVDQGADDAEKKSGNRLRRFFGL